MEPLSQRLISMGGGATPTGYWIAELSGSSDFTATGINLTASGNVYGLAQNNFYFYIYKFNQNGLLEWQRSLGTSSQNGTGKIRTDGSENCYVAGWNWPSIDGGSSLGYASVVAKYNSSGNLQYQRFINFVSNIDVATGIDVDRGAAFGEACFCGFINTAPQYAYVAKLSSSGGLTWQRTIANTRAYNGLSIDPQDNIYFTGVSGSSLDSTLLCKLNSSGNVQWQRRIGSSATEETINDVATGAVTVVSGEPDIPAPVFITGGTKAFSPIGADRNSIYIIKYNASGDIEWQRLLSGDTGSNTGIAIATAGGNSPVIASVFQGGILIAKYDESGNLQWQRILRNSAPISPADISMNSAGDICLAGYFSGSGKIFTCKLRPDGSGLGTFGSYTYEAGTASNLVVDLGSTSISFPASASSLSFGFPTLTSAVGTASQTSLLIT